MHDPKTLAFEIGELVHIWHVDPERNGDDDSCGWFLPHLTDMERAYADSLIDNDWDNLRHWFDELPRDEMRRRVRRIFRLHKASVRHWWQHPRWHVWHWEIGLPWLRDLKRWAFSRCQHCGGRFALGEVPIGEWGATGPKWFRNGERIWHERCRHISDAQKNKTL